MAEVNPPVWLDAGSYPAELMRRALKDLIPGGASGVVESSDLAVTANGTPNMSVNVATGSAFILGTEETEQGAYHVYNDATANLTVTAAHATNARKDLVVAEVLDSSVSGASDLWRLRVVAGTPAASPADPATPNNALLLARITVPAAATTITSGDITNLRNVLAVSELHNHSRHGDAHSNAIKAGAGGSVAVTNAWADVPSATVTFDVPRTGMTFHVPITASFEVATVGFDFVRARLVVDGSEPANGVQAKMFETGGGGTCPGFYPVTGLSAASHTFKLQVMKDVNAGSVVVHPTECIFSIVGYG